MSTAILRGLIKLADDAPSALTVQIEDMEPDDPDDELEMFEPIGVHFLPSLDDEVLALEVNGSPDNRVVIGASQRTRRPQDLTDAGTGGLHYLGEWKVFLDADGTVHLGERDASDFVALASKVDAEFARIWDMLSNWTPVAQDGGAALKLLVGPAAALVEPVGSEVIKAV